MFILRCLVVKVLLTGDEFEIWLNTAVFSLNFTDSPVFMHQNTFMAARLMLGNNGWQFIFVQG